MKFIKQYPYISTLLIFSVIMFFIGIYAALVMTSYSRMGVCQAYRPNERYPQKIIDPVKPVKTKQSVVFPDTTIRQMGAAKVTYYGHDDKTVARTDSFPPRKIGSAEFSLVASFENPGYSAVVAKPENISLRLVLVANDESYATNRTFKIFLDGQLFMDSESSLEDSDMEKSHFNISLKKDIRYDLFVLISEAKKVRLQVGKTFIDLKKSEIQSFQGLVAIVEYE